MGIRPQNRAVEKLGAKREADAATPFSRAWPRRCRFCPCSLGLFVHSQAPSLLLFSSTLFPKGSVKVEVSLGWQNRLEEEPHGRKLSQPGQACSISGQLAGPTEPNQAGI